MLPLCSQKLQVSTAPRFVIKWFKDPVSKTQTPNGGLHKLKNFEEAWKIYEEAFPEDERRSLSQQMDLLENPLYNFICIHDEGELAGFIAWWELSGFVFIDHFAIDGNQRGKGLGGKFLRDFLSEKGTHAVLEVEKPSSPEAKKRIAFYERLGFHLNEYDYLQPPFSNGKNPVPLLLMSHPSGLDPDGFEKIKSELYSKVYSV